MNLIAFLDADGTWKYGIDAFIVKIQKENQNIPPTEELLLKKMISNMLFLPLQL